MLILQVLLSAYFGNDDSRNPTCKAFYNAFDDFVEKNKPEKGNISYLSVIKHGDNRRYKARYFDKTLVQVIERLKQLPRDPYCWRGVGRGMGGVVMHLVCKHKCFYMKKFKN